MKVTACIIGGLGNQMFEFACARALSLRLGAELQFETSNVDADPKREYSLHHFRGVNATLVPTPQGQIIEHWGMDYKPEIFDGIDGDVTIRGYFQSYKWFADCENQIRKDLALKSIELSREAVKMSYKCGAPNTVGLHVRMGDYRTEEATQKVIGLLPESYYEEALKTIVDAERTNMHVFLFSDEPDEAMKHLGVVKHKNLTVVRGMTDIEDLWLLACCRHLILSNSSFSWWAAWGNMRGGIKIAPKKWLVDINSDDLCPPSWIRL